jgi:hypothetical protein
VTTFKDDPDAKEARLLLIEVVEALGMLVEHCAPSARNYFRAAIDAADMLTDLALTNPAGLARSRVAKRRWTFINAFFEVIVAPDAPDDPTLIREARAAVRRAVLADVCAELRDRTARLSGRQGPHL